MFPDLDKAIIYSKDILNLLGRHTKINSYSPGEDIDPKNA